MPAYLVAYDIVDSDVALADKLAKHLEAIPGRPIVPGVWAVRAPANAATDLTADLTEVVGESFAFAIVRLADYDLSYVLGEAGLRDFIERD